METILNGRYRLLKQAGGGGTAVVWKAFDKALQVTVAAKVLKANLALDPKACARFTREARRAARMRRCPQVVDVHDTGEDVIDGIRAPYLIMEFLSGGDLAKRLEPGPLPPPEAASMALEVLAGLSEIHRHKEDLGDLPEELRAELHESHGSGLWHGDIKPANIMFDAAGNLRIVDFGISRVLGGIVDPEDMALMTVRYVSPEQIQALQDPAGLVHDGKLSDIYSLGLVLFEALTGEPFAHGSGKTELARFHLVGRPLLDSEFSPEVPRALIEVVRRATQRDPERRYSDAHEMRDALLVAISTDLPRPARIVSQQMPSGSAGGVLPPTIPWAVPTGDCEGPPVGHGMPRSDVPTAHFNHHQGGVERGSRVSEWVDRWFAALRAAVRFPGYYILPDQMRVRLAPGVAEPARGWESFLRAVDRQAARRLLDSLRADDQGHAVRLPTLFVTVDFSPVALDPEVQMIAWQAAPPAIPESVGGRALEMRIEEDERRALEMAWVKPERRTGWRHETWTVMAAEAAVAGVTFGSDVGARLRYEGEWSAFLHPTALTIERCANSELCATAMVVNPAGACHWPASRRSLRRRIMGLAQGQHRRIEEGGRVEVHRGDRISFSLCDGVTAWLQFS